MNRPQWIVLALAALNLALVWLFPPYDYLSAARNNVPTFDGFYWIFDADLGSRAKNVSFLQLELFVIVFNAAVAWLLLKDRASPKRQGAQLGEKKHMDWQRLVLIGVCVNLALVLLFPPMENYFAVTHAALPSFDGFYFVFGSHGARQIVTELLYIEVFFVLANGAILWLLFRKSGELTNAQRARLIRELQQQRR
jgi:hypothetical protein